MFTYVVFDAANTLIHKPETWDVWIATLKKFGYDIPFKELIKVHKLTSETCVFPDKTNQAFYQFFNAKVLCNLGIITTEELLKELFFGLKNKPWEAFTDVEVLKSISCPLVIASNFNQSLIDVITPLVPASFEKYFISENMKVRKPSKEFYQQIVTELDVNPNEILYIGDSLELDVIPARNLGIQSYLIDRDELYPRSKYRLTSLAQLTDLM
jgi:putative hydrolase of the HAD superfamily